MKPHIKMVDVSLRDGSHAIRHQFDLEQVRAIASGLDKAGVPIIEVSHGDGVGGSSVQYGFSKEEELAVIQAAAEVMQKGQLSVLLIPGIGTMEDLKPAVERGVNVVRVATHVTEADVAQQHIQVAKKQGLTVGGFLMMSHMGSPEKVAEQGKMMESYGADVVYVVDSAGALLPDDARRRVAALREVLSCDIGFHAHNNLSLAVANSLLAIEEGARWIDGSLYGFGAGSGNTAIEVLATVLQKLGYRTDVDMYALMDLAEEVVQPILPRPQVVDRTSLVMGYAGVYSTFLLHTKRAAERFGLDSRDILIELGRRGIVGGQEDMIVDVAVEMAEMKELANRG